ncbi:MAG: hypothetical protein HZR80_17225 [Candidatus Heimdallarchaeota archaeon]
MRLKNKSLLKSSIIISLVLSSLLLVLHPTSSDYTKKDFVINNDSKELLDLESDLYFNGSISVTVTTGDSINATVNGVKKEIALDETKTFEINNSSTVYFVISSYGYSQGFYELELDLYSTSGNPITTTIGILAAFILAISVVSFYLRAKKIAKENEEEDEELADPETVRKRKEAAGAEKKFWGLDDK